MFPASITSPSVSYFPRGRKRTSCPEIPRITNEEALTFSSAPFMKSCLPLDHGYASSITFKDLSPWYLIFLYILSFQILLATNSIFETLWDIGYDIFKENYWERKVFNVAREAPGRHISIHRDSFSALWSECYFFHQQWWNPLPLITKGRSWETQGQMAKVLRTIEVEDEKTEGTNNHYPVLGIIINQQLTGSWRS